MKTIKRWFFKTCPKSGRVVGVNKKNLLLKVCFPLLGLAALAWFLIRVVPKPSRVAYPCQQIAAPLAISFVAFFSSTWVGWKTWKKASGLWHSRRFYPALIALCVGGMVTVTLYIMSVDNSLVGQVINKQIDNGSDMGLFSPSDESNTPVGTPRGIHPGRVAWAHDPLAAAWDEKTGLYSDAANNSQTRVDDMVEGVIRSLTDHSRIDRAWNQLFTLHNAKKGKGKVGYKKGEKIAIKINLNNNGGTNIVDATPQSVRSLLHQLVDIMQVPQECITVYDAQRRGISAVYTYNHPLYPEVIYQNWGGFVPSVIRYSAEITDEKSMSLARAAYEADYLINMALLKRHAKPTDSWKDSAGQTGITGTGKNQFGSIGSVSPLHLSIRDWSKFRGMGSYNPIVDLMGNERIGENTLVFLIDALYPTPIHNGKAIRFQRAPFNGGWTSSFFGSNDQVAIESVLLDFMYSEIPVAANADNFLHEAARIGNPPSGIQYTDRKLGSLGVHEHWNNPDDRMYTRNLGTGKGIELYRVPLDGQRPAIECFYADKEFIGKGEEVTFYWKTSNAMEVTLNGKKVTANGQITLVGQATGKYLLEVNRKEVKSTRQELAVRCFSRMDTYPVAQAVAEGSAVIDPAGFAEFRGEKGSSTGILSWNVRAPNAGTYYLIAEYSGSSPVPSYLYLNDKPVSENFGYLAAMNDARGHFVFPVTLNQGTNAVKIEHPGRQSNRFYRILIAGERTD